MDTLININTFLIIIVWAIPTLLMLIGIAAIATMCILEGLSALKEKKRDNARFVCEASGEAWHRANINRKEL